jgi:hypothetical protein
VNFVPNPPWVGRVLADTLKTLASTVKPDWLPELDSVTRGKRGSIVARVKEYGCGVYGCVIPTLDPYVVMKLTTDDTEAEFAAEVADTLVAPICVKYHVVLETKAKHLGNTVYLLWRDAAERVGGIRDLPGGDWAVHFINLQHRAAQAAFRAVREQGMNAETTRLLIAWAESCEAIARQIQFPGLRELGEGLVEVWGQQHILFGDIHEGNIGMVDGRWVITDPGNIAVVDRTLMSNPGRRNPDGGNAVSLINAAARKVATGPGRGIAYISEVWDQIERDGDARDSSYDEFKCELINLFRRSDIVLQPAPSKDARSARAKTSRLEIGDLVCHVISVAGRVASLPGITSGPARTRSPDNELVPDDEFARTVNEIASDTDASGRHGDRKVFISEIWDVASADPEFAAMGAKEFKRRLVQAHQASRIVLVRADYVAGMDPVRVRESETVADGATFHFVEDPKFRAKRSVPAAAVKSSSPIDIVGAVRRAVEGGGVSATGRFGKDKVFISAIWKEISGDARIGQMGLPAFKRWLINANRDRVVDLARADLVDAMDRTLVKESEIEDRGSTFHFVIDRTAVGW